MLGAGRRGLLEQELVFSADVPFRSIGGGDPILFADADLTGSFVMLEPSYLYNVDDLKFYRPRPPLQATSLPAALVDVAADPLGDFHAIRLR